MCVCVYIIGRSKILLKRFDTASVIHEIVNVVLSIVNRLIIVVKTGFHGPSSLGAFTV